MSSSTTFTSVNPFSRPEVRKLSSQSTILNSILICIAFIASFIPFVSSLLSKPVNYIFYPEIQAKIIRQSFFIDFVFFIDRITCNN